MPLRRLPWPLGNFISRLSPPLRRGLQSQGKGEGIGTSRPRTSVQESPVIPKNRNLGGEGELLCPCHPSEGCPGGAVVKKPRASAGDAGNVSLIPGSGRFPWSGKWQPTLVFLSGKFHGQRSLVGYSPEVCKESNTRCLNSPTGNACIHLRLIAQALNSAPFIHLLVSSSIHHCSFDLFRILGSS